MRKKNQAPAPKETKLKVTETAELMTFLLAKMGGMSRNSVKSLLSHRQVMVNNKISTQFNLVLKPNDLVVINSNRGNTELVHPKLRIIYEDQYLIVVDKKEGLLAVQTEKKEEVTAFAILKNYVRKSHPANKIYVVHRIDRETSGVIMFAKTKEAQETLQYNWHRIITRRIYTAVVEGKVEKEQDTIVTWLTEHPRSLKITSSPVDNGGQEAITHYKTLMSNDGFSMLDIELETGRKNQIRVHMQDIGHPIVGDKKYGSASAELGRIGLHARLLEFYHPITTKLLCFESPVPKVFKTVFRNA